MTEIQKTKVYFRNTFVPFEEATLSIASAPVLYGLSIYTVIPVFWTEKTKKLVMFRLKDHFKRLQNSSLVMAFDDFLQEWDYLKFEKTIKQLLEKNSITMDSLVRVSVFVDDNLKGTRMHGLKHSLSAFVYPMTPILPESGAKLMVSSWRRTPDNAQPARAKINGSYVNAALMKHEALMNGFDDAIALDEQGHVTESTVANIFLVRNGHLVTPGNSADLLEGITRDSIFRFANHIKVSHEQRTIDRSELYLADEIFLCGSSMSIVPVIEVDHRKIGKGSIGPLTKRLQLLYQECTHQRSSDFDDWLTPVAL
jgi:branched-chain amino acid aminotransferase